MRRMIEALKEGRAYDYICNNGHEMTKGELIDIIKEYDYAINIMNRIGNSPQHIYNSIAEELEENYAE